MQAFISTPENYSDTGSGVEFKSSGNIVPVKDYNVIFAVGSENGTVQCPMIEIIGDTLYEPTTFFVASIRLANSADMVVGERAARVIITDNDTSKHHNVW